MSHRRLEQIKKDWSEAEDVFWNTKSFTDWWQSTLSVNVVLFAVLFVIWWFFQSTFTWYLLNGVIAFVLFLVLVTLHEFAHDWVASYLGYKCEFETSKVILIPGLNKPLSSVHISVLHERDDKWNKDRWIIALAPYVIMFPVGFSCLMINFLGLNILGILVIIGHIIALVFDILAVKQ